MVALRRARNPLLRPQAHSHETEQEVRNDDSHFEEGRTRPPLLVAVRNKITLENSPVDCFQQTNFVGIQSIARSTFGYSLLRPKRHAVTFWRFTLPRTATRGERSCPLPLGMALAIPHPFHRLGRKGISRSAERDQRALPSGLLRAGLSSTSFSRRLRRLQVVT